MASILNGFAVSRSGENYLIRLEDEDGNVAEYETTFDQLDLIAETVDDQLNSDEEDNLAVDPDADGKDALDD